MFTVDEAHDATNSCALSVNVHRELTCLLTSAHQCAHFHCRVLVSACAENVLQRTYSCQTMLVHGAAVRSQVEAALWEGYWRDFLHKRA